MTDLIGGTRPLSDVESVRLMRLQTVRAGQRGCASEIAFADRDQAEISASAKQLQQARGAVLVAPETRQALVQRLRAHIESGEYEVDKEKLARRIVDLFL